MKALTVYQHEYSESDHVPASAAVVLHHVDGPGDVAVAVVTAQVVHPLTVDIRGLADRSVVGLGAT